MANWCDHSALPTIHPDEIVVNGSIQNIRKTYDEAEIEAMAASILDHGLINPLTLIETEVDDEPQWELVAGSRRLRAIQLIRNTQEPGFYDEIPFIPFEGELSDAVFANAAENIDREDLNAVDVCEWLKERVEEGWQKSELGKRFSKSQTWVEQRLFFIENASQNLIAAVRSGTIKFSTGLELAKKTKAEQDKFLKANEKWLDKITSEDAKNAGSPDRVKRPTKGQIEKKLDEIKAASSDQPDNKELSGMELALRWVVGLLDDAEFNEVVANAKGEGEGEVADEEE